MLGRMDFPIQGFLASFRVQVQIQGNLTGSGFKSPGEATSVFFATPAVPGRPWTTGICLGISASSSTPPGLGPETAQGSIHGLALVGGGGQVTRCSVPCVVVVIIDLFPDLPENGNQHAGRVGNLKLAPQA